MNKLEFLETRYKELRPYKPMNWMRRMFCELLAGQIPAVVDLPTASGKTDVLVIWLIALAWYANNKGSAKPIPRRLVWVVNRRVLVQQVYDLAQDLEARLAADNFEITKCLRSFCAIPTGPVFNVAQLRGQRLDDREWALDPTIPQLIIGTVDQIGSRLLFQGYGLGKWSRPLHAGILGVDAWICVDEAHLVPAFVATLRQVREIASRPISPGVPEWLKSIFDQLPFWVSELSATPGLPKPKFGNGFTLETEEDKRDDAIKDRLRAKETRRVIWKPLADAEKKKFSTILAQEALAITKENPDFAVAIFCFVANVAENVANEIEKVHKGQVLLVTGRVRGYEREMLTKCDLFKRFRRKDGCDLSQPVFLIGTTAAEIGLDADADAIVCDFASLLTLIQRLGRLDRIGLISKQLQEGDSSDKRPTMTIIGGENGKIKKTDLETLAKSLSGEDSALEHEWRANFFSGSPWAAVTEGEEDDEKDQQNKNKKKGKTEGGVEDAILAATWQTLFPKGNDGNGIEETSLSSSWLNQQLADITTGPVVVPPLTDAVLRRWAATTPPPPKFLPVHPWLYGLLPNEEGTPLVGVAFRLELDILKFCSVPRANEEDGDDGHDIKMRQQVKNCLSLFPPLRSELHFVPINILKDWMNAHEEHNARFTFAHFDGDTWRLKISSSDITPASVVVFPTSTTPDDIEKLIPKSGGEKEAQRCWDVFNALAKEGAKYRREITIGKGCEFLIPDIRKPDVYRLSFGGDIDEGNTEGKTGPLEESHGLDTEKWKATGIKLQFSKEGIEFELRYFKPRRGNDTGINFLKDHLASTAGHGRQLAAAIAPANETLSALLGLAGGNHDDGKDHDKWQETMGNTPTWRKQNEFEVDVRVAKPVVENPGNTGYRHEWGTLWRQKDSPILGEHGTFFRDLALHLIAAHHGWFRPSMPDRGFDRPPTVKKQNPFRLEAIERFGRLQSQLGYWRLAWLESLLKAADVAASRGIEIGEVDDDI